MKTHVLTHRGLDPSKPNYFVESSVQAFGDQLMRGYGLEFDVQFSSDGVPIAFHDSTLLRLTKGEDARSLDIVSSEELLGLDLNGCHLATVEEVLSLITHSPKGPISALHLKTLWQKEGSLTRLVDILAQADRTRFFVFDVLPNTARSLKRRLPDLMLAPSVAHPYDIARFNKAVGGTLLSLSDVLSMPDDYDWVWLDEWDRKAEDGGDKTLYNAQVFGELRASGFKIALVTPEMHATSPGLLGGEAHEDARDHETLISRIKEILALQPDAVCTDLPDEVRALIG